MKDLEFFFNYLVFLRGFWAISDDFRLKFGLFAIFWISSYTLSAQSVDFDDFSSEIQSILSQILEEYVESIDAAAEQDLNSLIEDIVAMYHQGADLNQMQQADLASLYFLTEIEISAIVRYRKYYGPFVSVLELQAVPELSMEKAKLLSQFSYVPSDSYGADHTNARLDPFQNRISLKWKAQLERQNGFKSIDGQAPRFSGDPNDLYLRYEHRSRKNSFGITLQNDAGESFPVDWKSGGI